MPMNSRKMNSKSKSKTSLTARARARKRPALRSKTAAAGSLKASARRIGHQAMAGIKSVMPKTRKPSTTASRVGRRTKASVARSVRGRSSQVRARSA